MKVIYRSLRLALGLLMLIVIVLTASVVRAAESGRSYYIDDAKMLIFKIENDTATIYSCFNRDVFIDNDTAKFVNVSTCTVKNVDDDFFELTSIDEQQYAYYINRVEYQLNDTLTEALNDSLYFELTAPQMERWEVSTIGKTTEEIKDGRLCWSTKIEYGMPDYTFFTITPKKYSASLPDGQYLGLICFQVAIEMENHNYVKLEMPFLTENFFKSYINLDDYVHKIPEGFLWRGLAFNHFAPSPELLKQLESTSKTDTDGCNKY